MWRGNVCSICVTFVHKLLCRVDIFLALAVEIDKLANKRKEERDGDAKKERSINEEKE